MVRGSIWDLGCFVGSLWWSLWLPDGLQGLSDGLSRLSSGLYGLSGDLCGFLGGLYGLLGGLCSFQVVCLGSWGLCNFHVAYEGPLVVYMGSRLLCVAQVFSVGCACSQVVSAGFQVVCMGS